MSLVCDIVKFINDSLKESAFKAPRFSGSEFYGIATQVPRDDAFVMTLLNEKGETVKDNLMYWENGGPIQLYHRLWSSSIAPDLKDDAFGDDTYSLKRTLHMSMVVFATREKVQMSAEDLELFMYLQMPGTLPKAQMPAGIESCFITPSGSDFNQPQLLNREFKLTNNTLEPKAVLFELKYVIECKASKNCINVLCCP